MKLIFLLFWVDLMSWGQSYWQAYVAHVRKLTQWIVCRSCPIIVNPSSVQSINTVTRWKIDFLGSGCFVIKPFVMKCCLEQTEQTVSVIIMDEFCMSIYSHCPCLVIKHASHKFAVECSGWKHLSNLKPRWCGPSSIYNLFTKKTLPWILLLSLLWAEEDRSDTCWSTVCKKACL